MQAKLVIVRGRAGRREVVLTLPATIGRRAHQTLQILHPTVSREHCELVEQDGQILVRDKQSANGTWIGDARITEALLRPGDRLTVGPLVFEALYVPGNGAISTQAAPAKPAAAPQAKKAPPPAAKSAVKAAPQPTPEDDLEAAFAAELLGELGGAAPAEVADAAMPTLDGELPAVGEANAAEPAAGGLDIEAIVSDEPSAPWDAIVAEPSSDQALEDEEREVDLAPGEFDLVSGDLGLEEIDLGGLDAEPAAPEGFAANAVPDLELPASDELALDDLQLDNDLQFDEELKLDEPDAGAEIAADLELEQQLDAPVADDLSDQRAIEPGAAPAQSLDDFFANLQGSEVASDNDLPAIEIDELKLDADADAIDFTAGDDSVAEAPGNASASLELGGPELSGELELDLDLGLDDLGVAAGAEGEDLGFAAGGAVDARDAGPGDEGGLRIAELGLDEPQLGAGADVEFEALLPSDDDGRLHLDLVVDDEPVGAEATPEQVSSDESLHLFLAEEPADLGLDERSALADEPEVPCDDSPLIELAGGSPEPLLVEPLLDVVTASEPREPSTSDEAASQGAIHSAEIASTDSADEIALDADSQELWPVADDLLAADQLAIDALGPPEPFTDETALLLEAESPVAEIESAPASEPVHSATEAPFAVIPTAPDNVDPFDFLAIENTPTAAAEIVEPFVDDDNTPYDPDSPRQRLQALAADLPAPDSDFVAQINSEAAPAAEPQPAAELAPDDHLDAFFAETDAPPADEPAFDEPTAAEPDQTAGDVPTTDVSLTDGPDFAALDETVDASADSLLTLDETSVEELALLDAPPTAANETPAGDLLALSTGGELAPPDNASPALDELAFDDPGLEDLGLPDLGLGDPVAADAGLVEGLESPVDFMADLDLPAPPADQAIDDSVATESVDQGDQGSGAFEFLSSPTPGAAGVAAIGAAGPAGAPLITPPPGSGSARSEPMWWPFGDKSNKPDAPKSAPVNGTAAPPPPPQAITPAEPTAAASDLSELAPPAPDQPLEPLDQQFDAADAPLALGADGDDLALDDLVFEEAAPKGPGDDDLALDQPLAFDDEQSGPLGDLGLPSAPEPAGEAIAFLDDSAAAPPLDADTAGASLQAIADDLATADPALAALELSDLPAANPPGGRVDASAAATAAAPARKWWKFWTKSDKAAAEPAKPAKPAKIKADKKAKTGAESQAAAKGAPERATLAVPEPNAGLDDLLVVGAASSALEGVLEPQLDFEPLELGDTPAPAASSDAAGIDDNFDTIFVESSPVADEPVLERPSPEPELPALAADDPDEQVEALAFDSLDESAVPELDLPSSPEAEPDFMALDAEAAAAEDAALDSLFGEESSTTASTNGAVQDEPTVEPEIARADEPESESESALPGAADTVDDNLLDDFFKNF